MFLLFPGILLSISPACRKTTGTHSQLFPTDSITAQKAVHTKYDISYDSLNMLEGTIKRNQNISDLLRDNDVSFQTINVLVEKAQQVINLRKIRRGNQYTLFFDKDSINNLQYLVYEHSPT